ncbi:MAG TPA: maleylpyruvate isomerase N-terminal domain-containing protein, partial [Promineifilum sp.]|nr:maleylpyruvate isomerase N-terminal domain-containing protein [Promineifilum sp.]
MTDFYVFAKDALLDEIGRAWDELNRALDELTPTQMSGPTDANGWRVQDHLSHMGAWHNWARLRMQGRPTWEGLGISE